MGRVEGSMANEPTHEQDAFAHTVKDSLGRAEGRASRLQSTNTWLLIASIATSAATTLVAGGTATVGPVIGTGDAGWRLACIVAAVLAFLSTIFTAVSQQLNV